MSLGRASPAGFVNQTIRLGRAHPLGFLNQAPSTALLAYNGVLVADTKTYHGLSRGYTKTVNALDVPLVVTDPYFTSVVQLAHFNGANGSTTFINSCPRGTTLIAVGGAAISTAQSKWGGSSLRVANGSTDGAVDASNVADYGFGTGDLTLEWWQRLDGIVAGQNIVFFQDGANYGIYSINPGAPNYYAAGVRITGANNSFIATTWQFVAYSRVGTTGVLYVDGASVGSWTDNLNYGTSGSLYVGRTSAAVSSMVGYIDDFRATKGVGRYTGATCPVPTAPFPNY